MALDEAFVAPHKLAHHWVVGVALVEVFFSGCKLWIPLSNGGEKTNDTLILPQIYPLRTLCISKSHFFASKK